MIKNAIVAAGLLFPALCHSGALYFYEMSNASESGYGGADGDAVHVGDPMLGPTTLM